jgi:hypothetical protein
MQKIKTQTLNHGVKEDTEYHRENKYFARFPSVQLRVLCALRGSRFGFHKISIEKPLALHNFKQVCTISE